MIFSDRREAGRVLARQLQRYRDASDPLVLALPRGGVPVAYEVARALGAPLDVFLVRKLGVPGNEELALGAMASGGVRTLNHDIIARLGISDGAIESVAKKEEAELARREAVYREARGPLSLSGRCVFVVDDGLATGASMRAAIRALREAKPTRLIVAVPIASHDTCVALGEQVDDIVCVATPEPLGSVGAWYGDFSQVSDEEVRTLLGSRRP